jgi:general secretion pathway protein J
MSRRANSGFTLIEVVVGTTILAMMMALLSSALFGLTSTARAGEARFDEADAVRLVQAFLRRQLEEAAPLTDLVNGEAHALFEGRADAMRFVGRLPAHRGGGGLQFIELRTETGSGGAALVLRHRPAWPDVAFAQSNESSQEHVLIPDVERVRYRYFGETGDDSPAAWRESWSDADRLPALIEIRIDGTNGRRWAPIRAAVRTRTPTAQVALFRVREGATP